MDKRFPLTMLDLHNLAMERDGPAGDYRNASACRADRDGEYFWDKCPQIRDGEPKASGRHCPLDRPPFRTDDDV